MLSKREKLIQELRTWIGVPFRHQGRTRRGIDCGGLLVKAVSNINLLEPEDMRGYGRLPYENRLKVILEKQLIKIDKKDLLPGDILLMKIETLPQHIGIVTNYHQGGLGLLHCYANRGKVVEHNLDASWEKKIIQCYRIPEIDK